MPTELPVACTLSATELPARLALMAELGRDAAGVELGGTCATLRFAAGPGVRERVERFVVAESACCAFLPCRSATSARRSCSTSARPRRQAGAGGARRRVPGYADATQPRKVSAAKKRPTSLNPASRNSASSASGLRNGSRVPSASAVLAIWSSVAVGPAALRAKRSSQVRVAAPPGTLWWKVSSAAPGRRRLRIS